MYILMLFSDFSSHFIYLTMLAMFAAPIGGGHSNIPSSCRYQGYPDPIIKDLDTALRPQSEHQFSELTVRLPALKGPAAAQAHGPAIDIDPLQPRRGLTFWRQLHALDIDHVDELGERCLLEFGQVAFSRIAAYRVDRNELRAPLDRQCLGLDRLDFAIEGFLRVLDFDICRLEINRQPVAALAHLGNDQMSRRVNVLGLLAGIEPIEGVGLLHRRAALITAGVLAKMIDNQDRAAGHFCEQGPRLAHHRVFGAAVFVSEPRNLVLRVNNDQSGA